jgi:hypothetical protein
MVPGVDCTPEPAMMRLIVSWRTVDADRRDFQFLVVAAQSDGD